MLYSVMIGMSLNMLGFLQVILIWKWLDRRILVQAWLLYLLVMFVFLFCEDNVWYIWIGCVYRRGILIWTFLYSRNRVCGELLNSLISCFFFTSCFLVSFVQYTVPLNMIPYNYLFDLFYRFWLKVLSGLIWFSC